MAERIEKATLRNPIFWVCFIVSAGLIITGFIVPPTGKIDGSVLTAVGELFGYPTLWVVWQAIRKGVDAKVQHGKTSVSVGNFDDDPPPLQPYEAQQALED